jgi:hypothetical protein
MNTILCVDFLSPPIWLQEKYVSLQDMKVYGEEDTYLHPLLTLALGRGECQASLFGQFTPGEYRPTARLDIKKKNLNLYGNRTTILWSSST